jgi:cytochrome c oxidase assembly factor CtaG
LIALALASWQPSPAVVVGASLALALFTRGFWRLRARGRGDLATWDRAVLFALGLGVLTLALVSPLDPVGERYLLSAHMLQHAAILDLAPCLLLLGLRGPLLAFVAPRPLLRAVGRPGRLRSALRLLLRPRWTFLLWVLALAVWHVPRVYDFALSHAWAHDLEHLSFLAAGLLVWTQLLDPTGRHVLSRLGRCGYALALLVAGHLVLHPLFSAGPLYDSYVDQPHRLLGLSPLADQHLAAWLMTADHLLLLGILVAVLLCRDARESAGRRGVPAGRPARPSLRRSAALRQAPPAL